MRDSGDVIMTATSALCTDFLEILEGVCEISQLPLLWWNKQPEEGEKRGKLISAVGSGQSSRARPVWATCAHGSHSQQLLLVINREWLCCRVVCEDWGSNMRQLGFCSTAWYIPYAAGAVFYFIPLYLGSFGWRNVASEETEGRGKSQKPSSGFCRVWTLFALASRRGNLATGNVSSLEPSHGMARW